MEESKARRVVDVLRARGTDADLARVGVHQFGVMVTLPDGREATWDSDDTATLDRPTPRTGAADQGRAVPPVLRRLPLPLSPQRRLGDLVVLLR